MGPRNLFTEHRRSGWIKMSSSSPVLLYTCLCLFITSWPLLARAALSHPNESPSMSTVSSPGQVELKLKLDTTSTYFINSNKPVVYYPATLSGPELIIGNDRSPNGGFKLWDLPPPRNSSFLRELGSYATGRTKLVTIVYDIAGSDWVITIAQPDSRFRLFQILQDDRRLGECQDGRTILGDWSALCGWRSTKTGLQYLYLFGKGKVVVLLVRERRARKGARIEMVEIQTLPLPVEAQTCTISTTSGKVLFGSDLGAVYAFTAVDSAARPAVSEISRLHSEITGLSIYYGRKGEEYLLVAHPESIEVFTLAQDATGPDLSLRRRNVSITMGSGVSKLGDMAIFQRELPQYPYGFLVYSSKGPGGSRFVGVSSLSPIFAQVPASDALLSFNPEYDPRSHICCQTCSSSPTRPRVCPLVNNCSGAGFCVSETSCECFAGASGADCANICCPNNCSGPANGRCVAANTCSCDRGWGGDDCSTLVVPAKYETDTTGGLDGDDPVIWIHPDPARRSESKIITTTKSKQGQGLAVFSLQGHLVQLAPAPRPNNVDVLYAVHIHGRDQPVDLAVAGCRGDKTICIFEITPNGTLASIMGGSQPLPAGFTPYGSCVYHSPLGPNFSTYIFINSKSSLYLQYLLTSDAQTGALTTTLARQFYAGNGGQVEGCVADDDNSLIFIGEEPFGLWAYPAEPLADDPKDRYVVDAVVGVGGKLDPDVEGVALVYGPTTDTGYILVSCQGVSAFNVYERSPPHEFVMRFSLGESTNGNVDEVTNTDGIAAAGVSLGKEFPWGIVVVHDDVNEVPGGGVDEEVSFKIVGLEMILGNKGLGPLGKDLLQGVGHGWDPRAQESNTPGA